ncbi:MAG: AAA family ATPase, partial [Methylomicrobium sp.]|nr:AAA family ATPase [Methylomicrobium sp.]
MSQVSKNIYITGAEQGSGKSVIMLAMMEMFSGFAQKIGFFRPIIHAGEEKDDLIELVSYRYQLEWPYEAMYGCTDEEARRLLAHDRYDDLIKLILAKYRSLKIQSDHVICVGSDYKSGESIFEFDFNADVANNLDCLLMPIIQGSNRSNEQIIDALAGLRHDIQGKNAVLLATVINSVPAAQVGELRDQFGHDPQSNFPVYVVPSEPSLEKPSMGDIARSLNAKFLSHDFETLNLEVYNYKV